MDKLKTLNTEKLKCPWNKGLFLFNMFHGSRVRPEQRFLACAPVDTDENEAWQSPNREIVENTVI